ncbi:MAG: hypothetical protein KatS3mg030_157 [Saprospiraceae bacterium]|nr:MAG: hypothetical protein KatS3mg030_157 [Saprospiraceae bacterium]
MTADNVIHNPKPHSTAASRLRKALTDVVYSFPFQLVVLHLRNHILLLGIWIFLALQIHGSIGGKFGISYLFLAPEYLGKVNFWSFFLVGVGFGTFVMSWNLTTYLLNSFRFSFLACLARPFTKFTLNNSLIPLGFLAFYIYHVFVFCSYYELRPAGEILLNILGFFSGLITLLALIALYFQFTNKDIFSYGSTDRPGPLESRIGAGRDQAPMIDDIKQNKNQWRVETYLTESLRPRLVRSVAHYDEKLLLKVFRQNHLNALAVQLLTLVVLILLGALMENPVCRIPTAASIFLLASIFMAVTGAIVYWFQRWSTLAVILLLLSLNYLTRHDLFTHRNKAYGLRYDKTLAVYHPDSLQHALTDFVGMKHDFNAGVQLLDKWKAKIQSMAPRPLAVSVSHTDTIATAKPKMVFFCVSGGGLKSTVWTMRILQLADSLTNGRFFEHTALISGASGGMLGAAYYRELVLRKKQGQPIDPYQLQHIYDVSRDLLNPISFTIITNDLFLPWASFEHAGQQYKKDRGYIFEKALNENTHNYLDKAIIDYSVPENEALIPMMFITPSIVNDGRRMIIAAQPVRYMMAEPAGFRNPGTIEPDAVDFRWLFANQQADSLRFTTALRMNATYPYILPNVYLPSKPAIEVLDAGFRDNFGLKSATRFAHVYSDWIRQNTSGVVFVIVRAFGRSREIPTSDQRGFLENIFNPLEIAFKIMNLQDYEHDNNLGFLYDLLGDDMIHIVRFTYHPSEKLKDSPISFYITERERQDILDMARSPQNLNNLYALQRLLSQ